MVIALYYKYFTKINFTHNYNFKKAMEDLDITRKQHNYWDEFQEEFHKPQIAPFLTLETC